MWQTTLYETSRLTLELRDIVDNGENSVDIWNFEYPSFYTGEEKKAFEKKVIDHFYFRQIGSETVGRFLHQFRTKVREIMPYYVQLYESEALMKGIEDPFGNVDITETFEQTSSGQSSAQSSGSTMHSSEDNRNGEQNSEHGFSNTPQGSISNIDKYMTEASKDNGTHSETLESSGSGSSESSSTGSSSETVTHTFTKKGNQGVNTYAHDMKELRATFLNIDMDIINDLNVLFLGVY